MKMKIQAGAEIETVTPKEMTDILAGWQAEVLRGARFIHPGAVGTATAAGVLAIGVKDPIGPREGFIWEVTRITTTGLTAAETLTVSINDQSPIMSAGVFTATVPQLIYGQRGLMLNAPDKLRFDGAGLTANKDYYVALQVTELPVQLGGRFV